MKSVFFLIVLYLFLPACGKTILLKGPKDDVVQCKGAYGLMGGQIQAEMEARSCAREYEKVGYKRLE